MMDENQLKEEIKVIKEHLTEDILLSVRSLLLGHEVSDEQKKVIQAAFSNPQLLTIVRRRIIQRETDNVPLGSMSDLWLQANDRLHGGSVDTITQTIKVGAKLNKLYKQMEAILQNPFQDQINFGIDFEHIDDSINYAETACDLIARNMFVRSVDFVMAIIKNLIGTKEESADEAVERVKKNSTK